MSHIITYVSIRDIKLNDKICLKKFLVFKRITNLFREIVKINEGDALKERFIRICDS